MPPYCCQWSLRHWKTEIVAASVEMLSGRRKKDYAVESAADALVAQAAKMGVEPAEGDGFTPSAADAGEVADAEEEEADAVAA